MMHRGKLQWHYTGCWWIELWYIGYLRDVFTVSGNRSAENNYRLTGLSTIRQGDKDGGISAEKHSAQVERTCCRLLY